MSDRTLISVAAVPMAGGVLALLLLQRAPAVRVPEAHAAPARVVAGASVVISPTKPWVGVVVAASTADLAAETEGRIATVFVRTGDAVHAGDKLLQFDVSEAKTAQGMADAELGQRRSEFSRAEARAGAAAGRLERARVGEAWLSQQEMDTAIAEEKVAQAELRAARSAVGLGAARVSQQRLRVERRTLVAPFDGRVVTIDADPGDSVVAGQVVLRVFSNERQARFAFQPSDFYGSNDMKVSIRLRGTSETVVARVSTIRPEVDPSAQLVFGTAPLPHDLPNAESWIPGAPLEVLLVPSANAGGR
jgi:RND family efflux transporter MFP subunit